MGVLLCGETVATDPNRAHGALRRGEGSSAKAVAGLPISLRSQGGSVAREEVNGVRTYNLPLALIPKQLPVS